MKPLFVTRAQVRELDRRASTEFKIPSFLLMENAARACAHEALRLLGPGSRGPVLVLCGPGNNGGDGFAIARTLANCGVRVDAVLCAERAVLGQLSEAAQLHAQWLELQGTALECAASAVDQLRLLPRIEAAQLVVDALFGTGLARPLEAPWSGLIGLVNAAARRVLAVDLPSGLDADTGAVLGAAIQAHTCVTFVAHKRGLLEGRGPQLAGVVRVAEIGIPAALLRELCLDPRLLVQP